ncbi:MAG: hypothetical protein H7X93_13980, partial [Sphingomonadaceae bacterium]|nr:hypothetical protein [Sphingomonadaceae bacterium]
MMDNLQPFGTEHDSDVSEEDDRGVEAPPQIGADERRMHVRAYNYWASLLRDRPYPSIADLDPAGVEDFGGNSVLLDFTAGVNDPRIAWLGRALREECGMSAELGRISEVPGRSLLSRLTDHYLQIIANQAPVGFEAEFVNQRDMSTLYRGILMPFSSDDDDQIDFIYGVINWKECAGEEAEAAIAEEVARARAPRAPIVPAVPVWADGPSADVAEADFDEPAEEPALDDAASLADWLVAARASAEAA